MAVLMAFAFLTLFLIIPGPTQPVAQDVETPPAATLASQIRTLPLINGTACSDSSELVSNSLSIMQDMSQSLGAGVAGVQIDTTNCDIVLQYIPVVGSYNQLIIASRDLNQNNATSVKVFYEDAFIVSSDVIIINDYVSYKIAFSSVGELNDALGLGTLRTLCGDECYSVVLSGIHWAIRDYMNQFLCQFDDYAAKYIQLVPDVSC